MPRPSKQASAPIVTAALPSNMAALEALERACEAEVTKWNEVAKATRLDYEAKAERMGKAAKDGGFVLDGLTPASRKLYVAAAKWTARKELRSILAKARKAKKNGETGKELFAVRAHMWAAKLKEASEVLTRLNALAAIDCNAETGHDRKQVSHKQKPATDAEVAKLQAWAAASGSKYADAFLVMEFSGCRGEELGKGVRVEVLKVKGVAVMRFHIESAKCDGAKKGLDIRCVEVPMPMMASPSIKRRWMQLAKMVAAKGSNGLVVKVDGTEGKIGNDGEKQKGQTPGQILTQAFRTASECARVKINAYSLRNRVSAQTKAASKGQPDAAVNVALVLGHQTTNTQRHYARAHRRGRGISPMQVKGINVMGATIRGPVKREGPPLHVRERVALRGTVPATLLAGRSRTRL